jgi:hypothetical protein
VRAADVTDRWAVAHAEAREATLAGKLKRSFSEGQYVQVIDAVERHKLHRLTWMTAKQAKLAHDYASAKKGLFRAGRRAGAIKGKAGNTREFLSSAQLAAIGHAGEKEVASQGRRVDQLTRHEDREAGRRALAEEAAKGAAAQKAAVETEKARGKAQRQAAVTGERGRKQAAVETAKARGSAKVDALREQHAADIAFERAHAGARVSSATTSPTIPPLQRELASAVRASKQADTTLRRAEGHLRRTLARPKATRKQVASAWGKVNRAERRAQEGTQRLVTARGDLRAERARTAGVAPGHHERLLDAITEKAVPRRPAHVPAVAPPMTAGTRERLVRKGEDAARRSATRRRSRSRRRPAARRTRSTCTASSPTPTSTPCRSSGTAPRSCWTPSRPTSPRATRRATSTTASSSSSASSPRTSSPAPSSRATRA